MFDPIKHIYSESSSIFNVFMIEMNKLKFNSINIKE